jgi:hypothetical protein
LRAEAPPDYLSNDPRNPYYDAEALKRDIGARFKGVEKTNVSAYCISDVPLHLQQRRTR